jgi:hypothetical protein
MGVGPVTSFKIESEDEADEYLTDLLKTPQYRSMGEVEARAAKYIKDARLKNYFVTKAKELLATRD